MKESSEESTSNDSIIIDDIPDDIVFDPIIAENKNNIPLYDEIKEESNKRKIEEENLVIVESKKLKTDLEFFRDINNIKENDHSLFNYIINQEKLIYAIKKNKESLEEYVKNTTENILPDIYQLKQDVIIEHNINNLSTIIGYNKKNKVISNDDIRLIIIDSIINRVDECFRKRFGIEDIKSSTLFTNQLFLNVIPSSIDFNDPFTLMKFIKNYEQYSNRVEQLQNNSLLQNMFSVLNYQLTIFKSMQIEIAQSVYHTKNILSTQINKILNKLSKQTLFTLLLCLRFKREYTLPKNLIEYYGTSDIDAITLVEESRRLEIPLDKDIIKKYDIKPRTLALLPDYELTKEEKESLIKYKNQLSNPNIPNIAKQEIKVKYDELLLKQLQLDSKKNYLKMTKQFSTIFKMNFKDIFINSMFENTIFYYIDIQLFYNNQLYKIYPKMYIETRKEYLGGDQKYIFNNSMILFEIKKKLISKFFEYDNDKYKKWISSIAMDPTQLELFYFTITFQLTDTFQKSKHKEEFNNEKNIFLNKILRWIQRNETNEEPLIKELCIKLSILFEKISNEENTKEQLNKIIDKIMNEIISIYKNEELSLFVKENFSNSFIRYIQRYIKNSSRLIYHLKSMTFIKKKLSNLHPTSNSSIFIEEITENDLIYNSIPLTEEQYEEQYEEESEKENTEKKSEEQEEQYDYISLLGINTDDGIKESFTFTIYPFKSFSGVHFINFLVGVEKIPFNLTIITDVYEGIFDNQLLQLSLFEEYYSIMKNEDKKKAIDRSTIYHLKYD